MVIADLESICRVISALLESPPPSYITLPSYTATNKRVWSDLEKHGEFGTNDMRLTNDSLLKAEDFNTGIGDIAGL